MSFLINDINSENYNEKRNELVEANSNFLGVFMKEQEKELDRYLSVLKDECIKNCAGKDFYKIPTLTDHRITESRLYKFCEKLPKGADLHVHDMALLPFPELVKFLKTCPEFCINTDRVSYDLIEISPDEEVPEGYMRFPDALESGFYSYDDLMFNWTMVGAQKSEESVWEYFEHLFAKHSILSDSKGLTEKYYDYTFRYYCAQNIMHVEIHIMLTEDIDECCEYIKKMRSAYYAVKKDYPYFSVRIIGAGVKDDNDRIETTRKCFLNASYAQEVIKDESNPERSSNFVIGFDIVKEEDSGLPLSKFAPMLLKVKEFYPDMKLYVHGGESLDANNENLIDAYLLGASRVGHGLNLYRFPDLHARYAAAEICLEVCPISNRTLGYTKDIRSHPATEYLRSGVALALCSDDAAYMENQTLTDDFFAAIVGWNLGIAELKQLGINSIMYSGLDDPEKFRLLKNYHENWNEFVKTMLKEKDE